MRHWSLLLGRPFGVELRLHVSFLFLLLFVLLSESPRTGIAAERAFLLILLMVVSVIAHELAHVIISARSGLRIRGIMLLPLGGVSLLDPHSQAENAANVARETRIALAGPLISALLACVTGIALMLWPGRQSVLWTPPLITFHSLSRSFFWMNLTLAAVNLLPAFPMDAGRILRARLARKLDFQQATRKAVTLGNIFSAVFMFVGVVVSPWLMLVGLFIFMAAQIEERTVLFQSVVEAVRLEDIMLTEFSTLSPADTLEDALHKAVHSLQDDFPVVRGADLVGVINRQTIVERLRQEGNGYVQSAMNKAFETAGRADSLASAFRRLSARGLTLIPVVDQGLLVGIVTLQNLMHSMGLLAESRRLRRQEQEEQT